MGQDRLNASALLSIEAQLVQEMDYIVDISALTRKGLIIIFFVRV